MTADSQGDSMDPKARNRRRQHTSEESRLVLDYDAISRAVHVEEPTGRGPALERLLDYLDPVFDRDLPPDAVVWGPSGAWKSAVVAALFANQSRQLSRSEAVIQTSTRAQRSRARASTSTHAGGLTYRSLV